MKIKVIIGPAKTFNKVKKAAPSKPKHILKSNNVRKLIDSFTLEEIIKNYKVSQKKAQEVIGYREDKNWYTAIELFGGLVFKQLELDKLDLKKLNENLLIVDPLYGPLKPLDTIQKYRLDMHTKFDIDLKEYWLKEFQKELKGYKVINLASKEYSDWLENIDLHNPELDKKIKQIKVARGKWLNSFFSK